MLGTVLQTVSRYSGTSTVGVEAAGQTVISVDSTRDFILDSGSVYLAGVVRAYNSVDRVNSTITLASALDKPLVAGADVRVYPLSIQRWAFVAPNSGDDPSDAVWCLVPHAIAAFLDPDGVRADGNRELVEYERYDNYLIITDVKDRLPTINADAIPDGVITETKVAPGSITTPLLAANAVATQNLAFGAATGDKLSAGALDGKTITGALIRTAASGRRIEITTSGLVQKDDSNVYLSLGNTNMFTGDVDATSMNIRDSLQLFGRNNLFAVGSKVTLKASTSAPATSPTLLSDYEQSGLAVQGTIDKTYLNLVGAHADSDAGTFSWGSRFFGATAMGKGANFYRWDTAAPFSPYGYTRAKTPTPTDVAVVIGEDQTDLDGLGFPRIKLFVYNDAPMNSTGTVAPTLLHKTYVQGFSWIDNLAVGRMYAAPAGTYWTDQFCMARLRQDRSNGIAQLFISVYAVTDTGISATVGDQPLPFTPLADNEQLCGVTYGSSARMGFAGADHNVCVVQTDKRNLVYNMSTILEEPNLEWPVLDATPQGITFTVGAISTETFWGGFRSMKYQTAPGQMIYKYTDHNWVGSANDFWAKFNWKGHSTTIYKSPASAASQVSLKKRSRLTISVPALPAPIAGVGTARDPAKDVYSWEYYIGQGATLPANTAFWKQTTQPAGDPTTTFTLSLVAAPLASGTNPPTASTFPAAQAATIESDNGLLVLSGDGVLTVSTVNGVTLGDTGWQTPALTNSWVLINVTPQYRRLNGRVQLRGNVRNGSAYNTACFTLPAGYRPGQPIRLVGWWNATSVCGFYIDTAGIVNPYFGPGVGGEHSLDGITFIAEA